MSAFFWTDQSGLAIDARLVLSLVETAPMIASIPKRFSSILPQLYVSCYMI